MPVLFIRNQIRAFGLAQVKERKVNDKVYCGRERQNQRFRVGNPDAGAFGGNRNFDDFADEGVPDFPFRVLDEAHAWKHFYG